MKSNIKNKSRYGISILMIAFVLIMIPAGQAAVSVDRNITDNTVTVGNSTNVTVVIQNDNVQRALSLKEIIPSGWTLTRGLDTADQFKSSTNEWVWFTIDAGATQTVIYKIKVPSNASAGVYNVNGNITSNGSDTSVAGDKTITVANNTAPTVQDSFKFDANPSYLIVNVGENAKYTLTINNLGSKEDTYGLTADKPKNAIVSLSKNSVIVGPGNSSTVDLTINASSIGSYIVNVTATSKANKSNTKDVTTKTDAVITPEVSDGFKLDVDLSSKTVNVGTDALYKFTISNIGKSVDTYNLIANSPNNATFNLANSSVTVGAGNSSAPIELTVNGSVTGTYTVGVTATSNSNKSSVKNITTTTSVVTPSPSSGGSRSSGGSSSGGGTYPTFTATPVKTSNATAVPTVTTVVPTVTVTTARPTSAIVETPVDLTTKKGSPGFEIILAIGMLATIYLLRRKK